MTVRILSLLMFGILLLPSDMNSAVREQSDRVIDYITPEYISKNFFTSHKKSWIEYIAGIKKKLEWAWWAPEWSVKLYEKASGHGSGASKRARVLERLLPNINKAAKLVGSEIDILYINTLIDEYKKSPKKGSRALQEIIHKNTIQEFNNRLAGRYEMSTNTTMPGMLAELRKTNLNNSYVIPDEIYLPVFVCNTFVVYMYDNKLL